MNKSNNSNQINQDGVRVFNENHMENCTVLQGDIYGACFPMPGANVTINQFYGKEQKKDNHPSKGNQESDEERDARKERVMKAITDGFNFEVKQLGFDNKGKRLTNLRLSLLFRQCFGLGSNPDSKKRAVIAELWTLLIDKRKQTTKQDGEEFYRQTVLNIIGYFSEQGLLEGQPLALARACFKNADDSMAQNIRRGITPPCFPEGTAEVLDYYIDKLMRGELGN